MEIDDHGSNADCEDTDDCYLCRMAHGDNEIVNKCHDYIKDSIGSVHLNEIVRQVHEVITSSGHCSMDRAKIKAHVCDHMRTQKIVLHHTLKDLTHLASVTKKCCVQTVQTDEQDSKYAEHVDLKMLSAYLKIIDQVVSVYRINCMQD